MCTCTYAVSDKAETTGTVRSKCALVATVKSTIVSPVRLQVFISVGTQRSAR